jgi:hypothetical protein
MPVFHFLENSVVENGCKFSLYVLKFVGISNCNRVPRNRSVFEFDLTKAKYRISRLSKVAGMLLCELALVISLHMKKENRHDDENKVYNLLVI